MSAHSARRTAGHQRCPRTRRRCDLVADRARRRRERRTAPAAGPAFVLDGADDLFVLPSDATGRTLSGSGTCWVLPADAHGEDPAWLIQAEGRITARPDESGWQVTVEAASARLTRHRARPHADVTGGRFALDIAGGELLADAAAGFYWGTMLPSVIERTTAADYPDADGYVRSTLAGMYAGTYPDVDHEFQIKGRMAWGSRLDLDVVRRMIELQLRLMREDPAQLWRDPCAVQPNGDREYHVRRGSMDGTENAVMFLVTGNIEVLESIWLYVARTKDFDWLARHIADIEGAASGIEEHIDPLGRLWGDVYYEDQVIKDGRETMAQALAVRSFGLLAQLEDLLGRGRGGAVPQLRDGLSASLVPAPAGGVVGCRGRALRRLGRPLGARARPHPPARQHPAGARRRRISSQEHSGARAGRAGAARVAAIPDVSVRPHSGLHGCRDRRRRTVRPVRCRAVLVLGCRVLVVARSGSDAAGPAGARRPKGAASDWIMGERYDMDHVYYVDGSSWHGAAHYYEYPCVYSWVLLHEYLGVRPASTPTC